MTIDEAIANYQGISNYLQRYYDPDAEVKLHITNGKCVDWFTEVAEWLTELKEAKRLLKLAVEDFSNMYDHIFDCDGMCDICPLHGERDHCLKWGHADETLKLIEGAENG